MHTGGVITEGLTGGREKGQSPSTNNLSPLKGTCGWSDH